jgi:hypothetical protein
MSIARIFVQISLPNKTQQPQQKTAPEGGFVDRPKSLR